MNKKYVGVLFSSNQWQIVPSFWIFENGQKCHWPNIGNVEDLAKKQTPVVKSQWSVWPIRKLCVTSGELIKGNILLYYFI